MVLALATHANGRLSDGARETLGFAARVAASLERTLAAVVSARDDGAISEAVALGAARVFSVEQAAPEPASLHALAALTAAARVARPSVICVHFDALGRELVGRLARRLDAAALTQVQGFELRDGEIVWERPVFGTKALGRYRALRSRVVIGVRAKSQSPAEPDPARSGDVIALPAREPATVGFATLDARDSAESGPADARVVVAGGRGVGGPEGFALLRELAGALGGTLGASRAACDAGWAPPSLLIGQSGATVAPDLYVAVGISGASQHLAGIARAGTVVAVNTDASAPIFKRADLGIVADFRAVLPALARELRSLRPPDRAATLAP